jgi:hypothetical protein
MRKVIGFILLAIFGVLLFGNIVMWLWNALMPVIFHLPIITFPQALGLLVLSKILFSSFRGGGPGRWRGGRLRQKWMDMTPEEQDKFKKEWDHRHEGGAERPEGRSEGRPEGRFDRCEGRSERFGGRFAGSRQPEGGQSFSTEKPSSSE